MRRSGGRRTLRAHRGTPGSSSAANENTPRTFTGRFGESGPGSNFEAEAGVILAIRVGSRGAWTRGRPAGSERRSAAVEEGAGAPQNLKETFTRRSCSTVWPPPFSWRRKPTATPKACRRYANPGPARRGKRPLPIPVAKSSS